MTEIDRDEERENRIEMEVIVDAYNEEEQAMGWYYYLDDNITFPFTARCVKERRISPLKMEERVTVIEMASESDCLREMFVQIQWQDRNFGIPLMQLEPIGVDELSEQAITDWHYWINRGHQLF
ncbi:conserved hypothetical protein [Crenothrix polyspora]|uniref:Calcium binding protein from Anabaena CcbP n=1 Tax=Crenothrix polyspora TaxID=360316 RepID=A0A1R4H3Q1_9GAMM|nr:calcium-binding protein [Crenothrix polyspora]SJM90888.1 conserved hypothetical protein [Crenothrix polyspora]